MAWTNWFYLDIKHHHAIFIRLRPDQRADRLVKTLIKLGPLFIKFGQILSTRRDLIPMDIANTWLTARQGTTIWFQAC